jgi:hypothetical protein
VSEDIVRKEIQQKEIEQKETEQKETEQDESEPRYEILTGNSQVVFATEVTREKLRFTQAYGLGKGSTVNIDLVALLTHCSISHTLSKHVLRRTKRVCASLTTAADSHGFNLLNWTVQ